MKYLLLLFLLSGCATAALVERVQKPYVGGTVKYLNQGADFIINSRISDAKNKMSEYCENGYEVLKDSDNSEFSGLIATPGVLVPVSSNYIYIYFKCL